MKLVDNWKDCWRWFSMHCMAGAVAIQGAWVYIPDDLKANIPHNIQNYITIVLLVMGMIGRVKDQTKSDSQ